jgi:hypothetical protein
MTTVTLDDVWQAIRESERSDEFLFMDDETSIKAEVARMIPPRCFQADGVAYDSIAERAISPAFSIFG